MSVRDAVRRVGAALNASVEEDPGGTLWIDLVVARRQAGPFFKRLRYRIGVDADPAARTVFFQEFLWEDDGRPVDLGGRLAEKEQAYRVTGADARGNVEGLARAFAPRYGATFDFPQVRRRLRDAVAAEGYQLRHLIPL